MDITSYLLGKNSGGGSSNIQNNKDVTINENGAQVINPDEGYTSMRKVTVTTDVPTGGTIGSAVLKDANLVDYDGTILASYTVDEFLALEELPTFPRQGLINDGWNWTLAGAKAYIQKAGKIDIGQIYKTQNGTTNIYFSLEEGRTEPYLGVCVNGTIDIDWGDNSATETLTGTSTTSRVMKQHIYSSPGFYVIKLKPQTGSTFSFQSNYNYGGMVLSNNSGSGSTTNRTYQNSISKIELGEGITALGDYAFRDMGGIKCVMIPNNITAASNSTFDCCRGLTHITFPSSITSITSNLFTQCCSVNSLLFGEATQVSPTIYYNMDNRTTVNRIMFPAFANTNSPTMNTFSTALYCAFPNSGLTTFSSSFSGDYCLRHINIPESVTTLSINLNDCHSITCLKIPPSVTSYKPTTSNCPGIRFLDFSRHTSIPTNSSNSIPTGNPGFKIIVPDDLYDDWIVEYTWSSCASYIIKKTDWDALQ